MYESTLTFLRAVHSRWGHYHPYSPAWFYNYAWFANDHQTIHLQYAGTPWHCYWAYGTWGTETPWEVYQAEGTTWVQMPTYVYRRSHDWIDSQLFFNMAHICACSPWVVYILRQYSDADMGLSSSLCLGTVSCNRCEWILIVPLVQQWHWGLVNDFLVRSASHLAISL